LKNILASAQTISTLRWEHDFIMTGPSDFHHGGDNPWSLNDDSLNNNYKNAEEIATLL
jgi:hypothetical protein